MPSSGARLKIFPRCLLFLPLLLSLQSCALSMAIWRDESQSPPSLKTETRQTQKPVIKTSEVQLLAKNPLMLSLQLHLDQEYETRELLVIEKKSDPSFWGSTLGTTLSLGLLMGGFWLDQQTLPKSASDEIGLWGWASLILVGADLVAALFLADTRIENTVLNESPWKAISESPGKALYLRKALLRESESGWQSETLTADTGQALFDLSTLPQGLHMRSSLQFELEVRDPIYGSLAQSVKLSDSEMQKLRLAFAGSAQTVKPSAPPSLSLEPVPKTAKTHAGLAVIIGNQDYRQAPSSEFALRDAEMVQRYSQQMLGFQPQNTINLANASKADLETVFGNREEPRGQMADWHKPKTPILIYYSGHGAATLAGKSFLLPVDANPNYLASSGYALETLYQNLAKLNYSELTVIIDACFSGMTPAGPLLPDRKPLVLESHPHTLPKLNRALFIHAAQSHEMSIWWKAQKHSLFTFYLLKGLQGDANLNQDSVLSGVELQHYLQTEVPNQARRLLGANQNPVFWGDLQRTLVDYALPKHG